MAGSKIGANQKEARASEPARIVVVVGAGASKALGAKGDLPLMGEWATLLFQKINEAVPGIAEVIGLHEGMEGPEFEQVLGDFLKWRQAFLLNRKFQLFGGPNPKTRTRDGREDNWLTNNEERASRVIDALRTSLFDSFGNEMIEPRKSARAYKALVDNLSPAKLVFATTNYDRALEIGLDRCGYTHIHEGFIQRTNRDTPRFDPSDFGDWTGCDSVSTAVLHLHGAVGWYSKNGQVFNFPGDQPYLEALGDPVFLPPDPNKDPLNDATVAGVWTAFGRFLEGATHILVVGHSLNDPVLKGHLARATEDATTVVAGLQPPEPLPGRSTFHRLEFSPDLEAVPWLRSWSQIGTTPARTGY